MKSVDQQFPIKRIGKRGPLDWPRVSPELTPLKTLVIQEIDSGFNVVLETDDFYRKHGVYLQTFFVGLFHKL